MEMLKNRLAKNLKQKTKWAQQEKIEAFRLYEKDIPEYPFIVDLYKNFAVVYEKGTREASEEIRQDHQNHVLHSLKEVLKIPEKQIIFKIREKQKGNLQYNKLDQSKEFFSIQEGPASFLINLKDYLDTGLFLDHRPMRKFIFKNSKGKRFLNLFSYTGSMSVVAALGGAITTSVDMSSTYQYWAQRNFELNQLPLSQHHFIVENALNFLKETRPSPAHSYDLIFLDPPTFSNSKRMEETFEVEKDQDFLIDHTMRLLAPSGTLYFSTNKRKFKLSPALLNKYSIKDMTPLTIPQDFRDKKIHWVFEIKKRS